MLGPVTLRRAWYYCAECRRGFAPRDQQLGISGVSLSPGLAEMIALAGAEVSVARAAGLLSGLADIAVSARTIKRSAEASGAAPARPPKPGLVRSAPARSCRCHLPSRSPTCCM